MLVGRDLIASAEIRAQITQIEKYNIAVNTFKLKYGYKPGDIKDPEATQLGFIARGLYSGQGDGNGIIQGFEAPESSNIPYGISQAGETLMFWVDLSRAGLMNGNFNATTATDRWATSNVSRFFPTGKISSNSNIHVFSYNGKEYYGLGNLNRLSGGSADVFGVIDVSKAFAIDSKIDDGLPMSGRVSVMDVNYLSSVLTLPAWMHMVTWKIDNTTGGLSCTFPTAGALTPCTDAVPASSISCFDNNNVAGVTQTYSVNQNNGNGKNCTLSFMFQ